MWYPPATEVVLLVKLGGNEVFIARNRCKKRRRREMCITVCKRSAAYGKGTLSTNKPRMGRDY